MELVVRLLSISRSLWGRIIAENWVLNDLSIVRLAATEGS